MSQGFLNTAHLNSVFFGTLLARPFPRDLLSSSSCFAKCFPSSTQKIRNSHFQRLFFCCIKDAKNAHHPLNFFGKKTFGVELPLSWGQTSWDRDKTNQPNSTSPFIFPNRNRDPPHHPWRNSACCLRTPKGRQSYRCLFRRVSACWLWCRLYLFCHKKKGESRLDGISLKYLCFVF